MLYCTWGAPREVFNITVSRDIQACSIVLYIIAERWVGARKYRDVFEMVKEAVLESIEQGGDEPRCTISNLRPGAREALTSVVGGFVEPNADFSAMLDDMIGSPRPGQVAEGIIGEGANQAMWFNAPPEPNPSNSSHRARHIQSMVGGTGRNAREGALDFMFPLESLALDALSMDFAVPEGMNAFADGLVDIPHSEWVMQYAASPFRHR